MILVTIDRFRCEKGTTTIYVLNTTFNLKEKKKNVKIFVPSRMVVLMMAIQKEDNYFKDSRLEWGRLIIEMCKECKNDVTLSTIVNHRDSKGSVYSFGNVGAFTKVNNSIVSIYAVRNNSREEDQIEVNDIASQI